MASNLELNLDPAVEGAFLELLQERGFASISEFIIDTLETDRAEKRRAKLKDIGKRMWPNGAPTGLDGS